MREGFSPKTKAKPVQSTLLPRHELGKLDVPESTRRLRKMATDASLNPDDYEAKALERKTRRARIRGIMAAGKARLDSYSKEHPELNKEF